MSHEPRELQQANVVKTTQIDHDWEMQKERYALERERYASDHDVNQASIEQMKADVDFIRRRTWWMPFLSVVATIGGSVVAALTAWRFVGWAFGDTP